MIRDRWKGLRRNFNSYGEKPEEQVIQRFPYRCPYCDQPISYDQFDLRVGENKIRCPSCKKIYIKVVWEEKSEL